MTTRASEGDETVILTLSGASGGASIGSPSQAVLTIIDNEGGASLSINNVTQPEGNGSNQMVFTVSLNNASAQTVTVSYSTSDGTATAPSDYTALPLQTLTFSPGETSKQVIVSINGDSDVEPDESFFVILSSATNATISDGQGVGTLTNDDAVGGAGIDPVQFDHVLGQ